MMVRPEGFEPSWSGSTAFSTLRVYRFATVANLDVGVKWYNTWLRTENSPGLSGRGIPVPVMPGVEILCMASRNVCDRALWNLAASPVECLEALRCKASSQIAQNTRSRDIGI